VIRGIKKTDAEKLAEGQPQVEVGSFLIIGTFKKHTMRPGDTLFKLARKVYGHKDYVKYIIRYNQFSDPNNVHIGSEILLPQLVEKEECAG
jgi:LysM repeat protein